MIDQLAAEGITVLERGWLSSNNVLLTTAGTHGCVLIDSGYVSHATQTLQLVENRLAGRQLERVVNTHLHSDHCGGNSALSSRFGCEIDIPVGEHDTVARWDEDALSYRATGQECPRFVHTGTVSPGNVCRWGHHRWTVVATPGHDPRSVALFQPELGILISADALWESGFGVIFPELEGEHAFDDVERTLEVFEGLPIRCVIPGHGTPFTDVAGALGLARRRIAEFRQAPAHHALHAAKVLLKFHLMAVRQSTDDELSAWWCGVRLATAIHERLHTGQNITEWGRSLVDALCRKGALRRHDGVVFDV